MLGIGLNVTTETFPAELAETATSLRLAGVDADAEAVLAALLRSLCRLARRSAREVLAAWRERDALLGERVRWAGGEGTAAGIDDSGALLSRPRTGA